MYCQNHFICKIKCVELRSFNVATGLLLPWTLFVGFQALNLLNNKSGLPDLLGSSEMSLLSFPLTPARLQVDCRLFSAEELCRTHVPQPIVVRVFHTLSGQASQRLKAHPLQLRVVGNFIRCLCFDHFLASSEAMSTSARLATSHNNGIRGMRPGTSDLG